MSNFMTTSTLPLPVELLGYILSCLPTGSDESIRTLLACSATSRGLRQIALDSSVWRAHAAAKWRRGTRCSLNEDAHSFYQERNHLDKAVVHDIKSLSTTSFARLPRLEGIRARSDQTIEVLRRLTLTTSTDNPDNWLCERYWAVQAYRCVLRDQAMEIWTRIAEDEVDREDYFELGVWAFVAFRDGVDYRDYLPKLNLDSHPELLNSLPPLPYNEGETQLRQVATCVMTYMSSIGFKSAVLHSFHHINNHFLSRVWDNAERRSDQGTLPMSLVSIFCSFVRRLPKEYNLRAKPIGFPGIMLAGLAFNDSEDWISINVFDSKIFEAVDLRRMLHEMGLGTQSPSYLLQPATAKQMCSRVAQNILNSVRRGDDDGDTDSSALISSHYAVGLAMFHFTPESRALYATWAVSVIQAEYPCDVSYLEGFLSSAFYTERASNVRKLCQEIRDDDSELPEPQERTSRIQWKIGQIFRHRLFGYVGVIRGFDESCMANEEWIRGMGVDTLPHGRHQPFYHVYVEDGGSRYVAQENIADEEHRSIGQSHIDNLVAMPVIGRYFSRLQRDPQGRWRFVKSKESEALYPETNREDRV